MDGSCISLEGTHNLGKLWVCRQENGNQEVGEGTLAFLGTGSLGSGLGYLDIIEDVPREEGFRTAAAKQRRTGTERGGCRRINSIT